MGDTVGPAMTDWKFPSDDAGTAVLQAIGIAVAATVAITTAMWLSGRK